ncbi:MAG: hydrogenase expression/formation protein HypE [Burkholderiales bacterium]|nr:hydrogenase expression/formation protein HypE [Burkholderiales bacterium]
MSGFEFSCPLPIRDYPRVLLAHGGGGRLMHELISRLFRAAFDNPVLAAAHDGAAFDAPAARLAFTTDSYVVRPLFFPGGDIGSRAVYGTVNDLAMCGARALHLSAGFILEEGLEMQALWRLAQSMAAAARRAGVRIVTGDTKVVERGKADGLYVNTAGIGAIEHRLEILPASVRPGDALLVSGDLGRHGIAVLAARAELALESAVESDCAPLGEAVQALLAQGIEIHCLRDLTRGGLAAAVVEVAEASRTGARLSESALAVCEPVRSACELLGFDPLHLACEGRFAAWVAPRDAGRALQVLSAHAPEGGAAIIGEVTAPSRPRVVIRGPFATERVLDMPSGEQLPRIC